MRATNGPRTHTTDVERRVGLRLTTTAACAVMVVGAVACGIPQDDAPQAINQALPPRVVEQASSTTTRPTAATREATLFLVRGGTDGADPDKLESVVAPVEVPSNAAEYPQAVLRHLVKGATADQVAKGLRSDIPGTLEIRDARLDTAPAAFVLVVDLSDLGKVEGPKQRTAVAQIVFTATAIDGIRAVRFLVDGQTSSIPIDRGTAEPGSAVTRDDFPGLRRSIADLGAGSTSTTRAATTTSSTVRVSTTTSSSPTPTTRSGGTSTSTSSSTSSTRPPGSTPPSSGAPPQTTGGG